jgi:peptide/nickel transport system substrate-binding protein
VRRALALALALALGAPAARAGVRPAHGGTLRVLVPFLPRTWDPALAVEPQDLLAARAVSGALLEVDAAGRLVPGLLAEVPEPEAGGRAFRLRLRPDLATWDGAPVGAAEVAAVFTRLASPATASPHAWAVLPVLGADALLSGRATTLAGVQVLSERELLVTLALPLPEFAHALAALPLSVPGLGPFQPPTPAGGVLTFAANERCPAGRPYASALVVSAADPRTAARRLERGEVDLVLRPEPAGGRPGPALPPLLVTVAALHPTRLGSATETVRRALSGLDRADLARRARGPSEPLATLVPGVLLAGLPPGVMLPGGPSPTVSPPGPPSSGGPPARITVLVPETSLDARAAAERIQVKLFDQGLRAAVDVLPRARFEARLAAGDYDVALVPVPVLGGRPSLAAAQVAFAVRGADGARRALAALAGLEPGPALAAAGALSRSLDLVPLVASAARASLGPAAQGLVPGAGGVVDPGGLWRLGGGAP